MGSEIWKADVERLLKDPRVDPSANDQAAIKWSAYCGYTDIMEILLQDPRVDPSVNNQSALLCAVPNGMLTTVERLLMDTRVDSSVIPNFLCDGTEGKKWLEIQRLLQNNKLLAR